MDELEAIRKKRLEELQQQQANNISQELTEQHQLQQQIQTLESVVKQRFTKEALERYGNVRAAHPDKAVQLLMILGQAIQAGQIDTINDEQLKEMLKRMSPPRETRITRK